MTSRMSGERLSTRTLLPDSTGIAEAARILGAGGLVAFLTETVYGLGADATDARAVARLYAAKDRPAFNPLIAHLADAGQAERVGTFNPIAERLAGAFWPGPLTLVVPAASDCAVCDLARAGLATVALRVPGHPLARELLRAFGKPVVAPSANRSGHVSPTTAAHVVADLSGRIDAVLDGGAAPLGLESTIVDCTQDEPRLLRPGTITREAIEAAIGGALGNAEADTVKPVAPGQLASHYATRADIRLDVAYVHPGEALLAFGEPRPRGAAQAATVLDLSPRGDLIEAAANLFAYLRALDEAGTASVAVAPIPRAGLGEAIRDRLARAAAPRS